MTGRTQEEEQHIIDTCTRLAIERIQFRTFVPRRVHIPDGRPMRAVLPGHIIHALKWGYGHESRY